tara:strand:+ start:55 stop:453 length:399 start_codon:yes stop_codon:yes gene_type:complete
MSKIIKKSDITTLVESTMKQAGILAENEELNIESYMGDDMIDEEGMCEGEGCMDESAKPDYIDLDGDGDKKESMKKASKDKQMEQPEEEMEVTDVVTESTNRLAGQASEHNTISENLKKDLASFNKIINYKY